jgi:hypothetical protein
MFSFGMIVHEVLTGHLPRKDGSRYIFGELPDSQLRPLLERLFASQPSHRPSALQLQSVPFFGVAPPSETHEHGSLEAALASIRLLRQKAADAGKSQSIELKVEEVKQDESAAVTVPSGWALLQLERLEAAGQLLKPLVFSLTGKLSPGASAALAETSLAQCFFSSVSEQVLSDSTLFDVCAAAPGQDIRIVMPAMSCTNMSALTLVGLLIAKTIFDGHRVSTSHRLASAVFSYLSHASSSTASSTPSPNKLWFVLPHRNTPVQKQRARATASADHQQPGRFCRRC